MRWPLVGSIPVVSVSSTTSRMADSRTGVAALHQPLHAGERAPAGAAIETGRHDEIRPPALARIGHLACEDRGEALGRHAGAAEAARRLHEAGRADDDDAVAAPLAAGFVEERDVEDHQGRARGAGAVEETRLGGADARVQNRLEPAKRRRIAEDATAELAAVDPAVAEDAREGSRHRR